MADYITHEYVRFEVTFELDEKHSVADIEKQLWRMGGTEVDVVDEWEA